MAIGNSNAQHVEQDGTEIRYTLDVLMDALSRRIDHISTSQVSRRERFALLESALRGAAVAVDALAEQFTTGSKRIALSPIFPSNVVELKTKSGSAELSEELFRLRAKLQHEADSMRRRAESAETPADFEWSL